MGKSIPSARATKNRREVPATDDKKLDSFVSKNFSNDSYPFVNFTRKFFYYTQKGISEKTIVLFEQLNVSCKALSMKVMKKPAKGIAT